MKYLHRIIKQMDPKEKDEKLTKEDMLNKILFGENYKNLSDEEKNKIFQKMLKFKCLD